MYVADMNRDFGWVLCQFSTFNKDDTLLLVCGIQDTTFEEEFYDRTGFGAIFSITGSVKFLVLKVMKNNL